MRSAADSPPAALADAAPDHAATVLWDALDELEPRRLTAGDWRRFEGYLGEILAALGMDLETPGTRETPRRLLRALYDSTAGYDGDAKLHRAFPSEGGRESGGRPGLILEGPIGFFALCEHHALPFYGSAHVGYVADAEIIGISKLTRLVRLYARRFTVQERIGEQVADRLVGLIRPRGVAVRLEAHHLCTQMRGVAEAHSRTTTTVWRGVFADDATLRREFLDETRARGS
jgi:GTP cyclohydrolase I